MEKAQKPYKEPTYFYKNKEKVWWALRMSLEEEVLEAFHQEDYKNFESFKLLTKYRILDKGFRKKLNKETRQKFTELEECLKEYLEKRAGELIVFTFKRYFKINKD